MSVFYIKRKFKALKITELRRRSISNVEPGEHYLPLDGTPITGDSWDEKAKLYIRS